MSMENRGRPSWSTLIAAVAAAAAIMLSIITAGGWAVTAVVTVSIVVLVVLHWRAAADPRAAAVSTARAALVAALFALATTLLSLLTVLAIEAPSAGLFAHVPAMLLDGGALLETAVGGVAAMIGFRRPTPHEIDAWSRRHGVPPTMAAAAAVHLQRLRAVRTAPAVFGFAVGMVAGPAYNVAIDVLGPQHPASRALVDAATSYPTLDLFLGGYLLGVLFAEVTRRPPIGGGAGARLETRRPAQYLTPTARRLPTVFAAFVVGALAASALAGQPQGWGLALAAVAVPVLVVLAQHHIVRRPQPMVDADALALDDTLRSSAAHALSGAASALLLVWVLDVIDHALGVDEGSVPLAWPLFIIIGTVGVYGLWAHYGSAHRGRRPERAASGGVVEATGG
jgi:hypothetical protein